MRNYLPTKRALDEICGDIPDDQYFPYFADIAIRSREILQGRSSDEIFYCALLLSIFIAGKREDLEKNARNSNGNYGSTSDQPIFYDSGNSEDLHPAEISDNRILKMILKDRDIDDPFAKILFPQVFPEPDAVPWHKSDFFALFAITKLAAAISHFRISKADFFESIPAIHRFKVKAHWRKDPKCKTIMDVNASITHKATRCAMEAMQAINDAECYKRDFEMEMDRRDQQSAIAGELNNARHKATYEAKERVLFDWEPNRNKFQSAQKAANFYAEWLEINGLKSHEPNTIAGWIRNRARERGIRLR